MDTDSWRLPTDRPHRPAASAGALSFVGGAGDFDGDGAVKHPGQLHEQLDGSLRNVETALATEGCGLRDVVRLKVHYLTDGSVDPWPILAHVCRALPDGPRPAITMQPVVMQPWTGQEVQLQAVAQRGWRERGGVRVATAPVPEEHRDAFDTAEVTAALRAGEVIVVAGQTAQDRGAGGVEQTAEVMARLKSLLHDVGASLSDVVKKEGYYDGTDLADWAEMAAVRARHFAEPGPVATVVPWHSGWPHGARTQVEVLAMREERNGFDKYIPRGDSWPKRVWDWPIPVPYRQGLRLRETIWLGGQVPWASGTNTGEPVLAGQLLPQTQFVVSYVDDVLRGFAATTQDLALLVCYFASDGTDACTAAFLRTLSESLPGPLPPLTLVPQPYLHNPETMVEIWGVARG